jgi:hypothetical protein
MRAIANYRTRRRTALTMLLVWLFALATGAVNACVLANSGAHAHPPTDSSVAVAPGLQPVTVTAGHLGVVASHEEDSNPSKPPCLKACDEDSRSLLTKAPSGLDLTDPGMAPFTAINWIASMSVTATPRRDLDARPPPFGPPARLRFSRLAL